MMSEVLGVIPVSVRHVAAWQPGLGGGYWMKMRPTLAGQETNSPGTEAKLAPVKAVNSNFMEFDESFTDSDNYRETRARSEGRSSPI